MEITEVRVKLMNDPNDRLLGFCSVTLDGSFVIRDLKIIQGGKGPFVAMPSRRLMDRCSSCRQKNHLRAKFCNQCGAGLREDRSLKDSDGRAKLFADIAHPINCDCREKIQFKVMEAFEQEKILAQQPNYICRYDDYGEDDFDDEQPIAASFARRDNTHRIDQPHRETQPIDQPQRLDFSQRAEYGHRDAPATTEPHVLKMPQIAAGTEPVAVRLSIPDDDDSFGSGIG